MNISDLTKITEELASDSAGQLTKLKGWNLISGLYEETDNTGEDLVRAYSRQARDIVIQMVRLNAERAVAGLKGNTGRYKNITTRLRDLAAREASLATMCNVKLKALANGKEDLR